MDVFPESSKSSESSQTEHHGIWCLDVSTLGDSLHGPYNVGSSYNVGSWHRHEMVLGEERD